MREYIVTRLNYLNASRDIYFPPRRSTHRLITRINDKRSNIRATAVEKAVLVFD